METMHFSLPSAMQKWVQAQVDTGQYATAGDYISELIAKDQQRSDKLAALQDAITRGLESGPAGELDIEAIKQEARQQAGIKAG